MMRRRTPNGPVKAFSIGFQEQQFNELEYAEIAARRFGAEHHTYLVSAEDCFAALPQMVRAFDEPFGNSSAIPTYFCARLAAENRVDFLLAGDGGDELFAGNEWYVTDRIFQAYHSVPRILRSAVIEPALKWIPSNVGPIGRARNYVRRAQMPPVDRILSFQFLYTHSPASVFENDFLNTLGGYSIGEVPRAHYANAAARDHLDRTLYMDMKITIADSDLPKVTLMSELAGIRPRFPFLDRSVAEFSGRIPASLKVKGMEKRYLFKRAFRDLLPQEIIAKKKHGFGIPVATWLRSHPKTRELMHDTLFSARAFQRGYFQRSFVEGLVQKHDLEDSTYYGDTLWTLLVLELWHRQFVDEPVSVAV
jgi:asparagine synthase (glutamine-hydrolysing)